jgi:hypothetical protein
LPGDTIRFKFNPHFRTFETVIFEFDCPLRWDPKKNEWYVELVSSKGETMRILLKDMDGRFTVILPGEPEDPGETPEETVVTGEQMGLF